jgi:hypothetical protein
LAKIPKGKTTIVAVFRNSPRAAVNATHHP